MPSNKKYVYHINMNEIFYEKLNEWFASDDPVVPDLLISVNGTEKTYQYVSEGYDANMGECWNGGEGDFPFFANATTGKALLKGLIDSPETITLNYIKKA